MTALVARAAVKGWTSLARAIIREQAAPGLELGAATRWVLNKVQTVPGVLMERPDPLHTSPDHSTSVGLAARLSVRVPAGISSEEALQTHHLLIAKAFPLLEEISLLFFSWHLVSHRLLITCPPRIVLA